MRPLSFYSVSVLCLCVLAACDMTDVQDDLLRANLNAPTLLQPTSSQSLSAGIAFAWTSVEEALHYELEFTSDLLAEDMVVSTAAPFYNTTLTRAGDYTWRVRAVDARGRVGYWSKRQRLTVLPR